MLRRVLAIPLSRTSTRAFQTTPRLLDAAAAAEDAELAEHLAAHEAQFAAAPKHGTVLYHYGMYPFYGLLGTTILSKELFILDDNFPAVGMFGAVFLFFTWVGGPSLYASAKATQLAEEQERHDTFDLINALVDKQIGAINSFSNQPAALDQFAAEYKQSVVDLADAEVRQMKYEAYADVVAQLNLIANQKAEEAAEAGRVSEAVLNNFLYSAFDDAKLVDQTIDEAIENIENTSVDLENSVVFGVYDEYVQSGSYDVERYFALQNTKEYFANN
jgi:hypothetical protein